MTIPIEVNPIETGLIKPDYTPFMLGLGVYALLTLICTLVAYHVGRIDEQSRKDVEMDRQRVEYHNKVKDIRRMCFSEAVARGFGRWEVSRYGSVDFKWKEKHK